MRIGIVSVMWNEAGHLQEWLDFHKAIGITDFFLFENGSTDETREILEKNRDERTIVLDAPLIEGDVHKTQMAVLREARLMAKGLDWVGHLDGDELLVPRRDWTIQSAFNSLGEGCSGVYISWLMMGERDKDGVSLLEITRCCEVPSVMSWTFKSFVRVRDWKRDWGSAHIAPVPQGYVSVDFCLPFFVGKTRAQVRMGGHLVSSLFHYKWRSEKEWVNRKRTFGNTPHRTPNEVEFYRNFTNKTRDFRAVEVARHHGMAVNI